MKNTPLWQTPDSNDVAVFQQVFQQWNAGNQQPALDLLRPLADDGRAWAAALMAWLRMQQGYPGITESITYAIRAAELGSPAQTIQTFNNAIAHLPSDPELAMRLPELLQWGSLTGGVDLVGQGWNLAAQGQIELGLQVMMLPIWGPGPFTEPQWATLVTQATERTAELGKISTAARQQEIDLVEYVAQAKVAIDNAGDALQTSANQAGLLVTSISSDATNSRFAAEATRNTKEANGAWRWGLIVLGVAAFVAVLPVILHYLTWGPEYSSFEQIGLHLASTLALGTFAGVLLARARSRDQAAQRAHDLSTAMGTMISYSNQIIDPVEKQRFMTTMGQLVLQAHLTSGSRKGGKDDPLSGMLALASFIKPATNAAATSTN